MTRVTSFMVATWRHSKNLTRGAPSFPILDKTPPRNSEKTTIPRMFMPDALVTLIVSTSNIVTPVKRLNYWRMLKILYADHRLSTKQSSIFFLKWRLKQLTLFQNTITIICASNWQQPAFMLNVGLRKTPHLQLCVDLVCNGHELNRICLSYTKWSIQSCGRMGNVNDCIRNFNNLESRWVVIAGVIIKSSCNKSFETERDWKYISDTLQSIKFIFLKGKKRYNWT